MYDTTDPYALTNARYYLRVAADAFDDGDLDYASANVNLAAQILAHHGHESVIINALKP